MCEDGNILIIPFGEISPGVLDHIAHVLQATYSCKALPGKPLSVQHDTYNVKKHILITGVPGIGKTTLIRKLSLELKNFHPAGFYTAEIREEGIRKGFELVGLAGRRGLLSHVDIKSPYRVGKYGVDIQGLENFLDTALLMSPASRFMIVDEIGKMECLSGKFRNFIREILDSEKILVATIALKGTGFIEEVKERTDVDLYEIT